jgi:hypothetical protein
MSSVGLVSAVVDVVTVAGALVGMPGMRSSRALSHAVN